MADRKQIVLITGSTGFVGKNLLKALRQVKNIEIVAMTRSTSDSTVPNQFGCDLLAKNALNYHLSKIKPDIVIHLAAQNPSAHIGFSSKRFIETNLIGTYNLIESCRNLEKKPYFIHLSTYEALDLCLENHMFLENSPYAASKLGAGHLVSAWSNTYGMRAATLYCSNIFGPFQSQDKLIPQIIAHKSKGAPFNLVGKVKAKRLWLYVDDVCQAIIQLMRNQFEGSFTAFGRDSLSAVDVLNLVNAIMEHAEDLDSRLEIADQPNPPAARAISPTTVPALPEWKPKTHFLEGVKSTIEWHAKEGLDL